MSTKANISSSFENILEAIRNVEKNAHIFTQLHAISDELADLEKYVENAFDTLDNHFQAYIQQINLLSSLIEFQRKVIHYKSAREMTRAVFTYIRENINYDHAFVYLKISPDAAGNRLIPGDPRHSDLYRKFLTDNNNHQKIIDFIEEKDLGVLLSNVHQFQSDQLPWNVLNASSAIIFPLRMQGNFIGFGILARSEEPFLLNHLSFINLILGLFSLLLFQHFYFHQLKRRLARQMRVKKIFDEVKYADYFEKGPVCIFSLDQSGTILHANTSALRNHPLKKPTLIGEKFRNFLPPMHRDPFEKLLHDTGSGELELYKCPMLSTNGFMPIWEFYITKMSLHGHFQLNIIFAVDVTRQHYREQQEMRNDVLDQIGQFSQVMNGYLNNLLTVMVPNVSLMKMQLEADHPLQKHVKMMEKSLRQASGLVRKFLNYDLADIDQQHRISLNHLLQELSTRFAGKLPASVSLTFTPGENIPPQSYYVRRITQLFRILVQNSLEAMPDGGGIRISTRRVSVSGSDLPVNGVLQLPPGDYAELLFQDSGSGMSPEILPHIFKPFFSTKIKNDSLGLGLFVAYKIVKDCGGEIFARSIPGRETRLYVYLPIKGETAMQAHTAAGPSGSAGQKPPRILIVDDEYNIRNVLREVFEMHGYEVYTAANGKEGVEVFERERNAIDLVILDMVMPVMDGKAAFKEILRRKPDQKIIMISGYSKREDLQEILRSGALAFMSKPFQINDIVKKVKKILTPAVSQQTTTG